MRKQTSNELSRNQFDALIAVREEHSVQFYNKNTLSSLVKRGLIQIKTPLTRSTLPNGAIHEIRETYCLTDAGIEYMKVK
jgi:hypothetical protein